MDEQVKPQPAENVTPSPKEGVTFVMAVIIALSFSLASACAAVMYMKTYSKPEIKVLFADGNSIFKAKMDSVIAAKIIKPEEIERSAKEFNSALQAVLSKYQKAGFLVINSKAVMTVDPDKDITQEIAKAVGVSVENK